MSVYFVCDTCLRQESFVNFAAAGYAGWISFIVSPKGAIPLYDDRCPDCAKGK